jgi:hypothetical protein
MDAAGARNVVGGSGPPSRKSIEVPSTVTSAARMPIAGARTPKPVNNVLGY